MTDAPVQAVNLVLEVTKLLDACKEYRATLDEANRRIDDLTSRLSASEAARDDAKRENADLFARQTALVSEAASLRKQRNEAEMERNCYKRCIDKAHARLDESEIIGDRNHTKQGLCNRIASLVARSHRNIRELRELAAKTADALSRVTVKPLPSLENHWRDPLDIGPPYRTELEVQLPDGSIRRAQRASYGAVWKWLDCTHPLQCGVRPFDSTHWRYPEQSAVPPSQPLD